MSKKELERYRILCLILDKKITQVKGAEILNVSARQIRNLIKKFNLEGVQGLISKKRGCKSNRLDEKKKNKALSIVTTQYSDFSPTLASEKLKENHGIIISRETLRKWMSEIHLWIPKQKKKKTHALRTRRQCFGELIQCDGSHEAWFEERGKKCVLIVFIDDATSKLTAMRFAETESLQAYFDTLEIHLRRYGCPIALYTDHFSVFEATIQKDNLTQFRRAISSLDINWIGANSPQAKGRVERCNRTLQDRLIKEMRLRGIDTIEEGNKFLEEYIEVHNSKFSKEPMKTLDLHRPLEREIDLSRALSKFDERTLTKDHVFQYENNHYKITDQSAKCFKGQKIEIRSNEGNMRVFIEDKEVEFKRLNQVLYEPQRELIWEPREDWHQCDNHPWKKHSGFLAKRKKEIKWYNEKTGNF